MYERLSEAELMIMKIIWEFGRPVDAAEIRREMEKKYKRQWASQTMSTYLKILLQKGHLKVERVTSRIYLYEAVTDEAEYQKQDIDYNVNMMTEIWGQEGFIKNLAAALHNKDLSREDVNELRSMLDELPD